MAETETTPRVALPPFRSIRSKLARLVVLSVGMALLIGAGANLWLEVIRYRETVQEALLASAAGLAAAVAAPVARGDADAVAIVLRSVGRIPRMERAAVTLPSGRLLAEAGVTVRLDDDLDVTAQAAPSLWQILSTRTVGIAVPIVHGGATVGRLSLVRDASDLPYEASRSVLVVLLAGLSSLGLGLLLAHRLQRRITGPLSELTAEMARLEAAGDDRGDVAIRTNDEIGILSSGFNALMGRLRLSMQEILERESEIIERLARAGEQRDDQTGQHVARVAQVSRIIAEGLALDRDYVEDLVKASPLHDVGKITVPDAILFKPGKLDAEERRIMERHAERGYEVLAGSASQLVRLAAEIALTHHERWDGAGYPRRIAGEDIPLSGRITAVADVCDALLSDRPYKRAWSLEQVRAHLAAHAGSHFDPACVAALLSRWHLLGTIYRPPGSAAERAA